MSLNHQNVNYGYQPQVSFDIIQSEMQAMSYLVAPGHTVYLLDNVNKVLYEKQYDRMTSFALTEIQKQTNVGEGFSDVQKKEISDMIAAALSQYNPHIPKKERKND